MGDSSVNRKMKVLHVLSGYPTASRPYSLTFVKSQIGSLISEGIMCDVFDIEGYKSKMKYLLKVKSLMRMLSSNNYDIIHAHYSYSAMFCLMTQVKKIMVVSFMGSDILGGMNLSKTSVLLNRFNELIYRLVLKKADAVIVKSVGLKDRFSRTDNVYLVPNGVNFDMFKPGDKILARKALSLSERNFIILFIGAPENTVKNFELAQRAFEKFKKRIKTPEHVELLVINGKPHESMNLYYNASDCLLLTSHKEGSPNVVKEALACNLPVISVDVGDVKEIIQGMINCHIVDYNPTDISVKIMEVMKSKSRCDARECLRYLDERIIARKIIRIYEHLTDKMVNPIDE